MTKYTIEIDFQTGDSLNTYEETGEVGHEWKNIERAKESLLCIKNHYELYRKLGTIYPAEDQLPQTLPKGVKWDKTLRQITLYVINDRGKKVYAHAFWCGHFETLYYAKIIVEDKDLIYEP